MKYAVVKCGGKQYLVKEKDEIYVDRIDHKEKEKIMLDNLAQFSEDQVELGKPLLKAKVEAVVVAHLKGDKIRVAKFKAKSRYRRVRGFRPQLTKIQITKI